MFITAGPITKLFAGGGGGEWRTCAMRDDEPRPASVWTLEHWTLDFGAFVWMSPLIGLRTVAGT